MVSFYFPKPKSQVHVCILIYWNLLCSVQYTYTILCTFIFKINSPAEASPDCCLALWKNDTKLNYCVCSQIIHESWWNKLSGNKCKFSCPGQTLDKSTNWTTIQARTYRCECCVHLNSLKWLSHDLISSKNFKKVFFIFFWKQNSPTHLTITHAISSLC